MTGRLLLAGALIEMFLTIWIIVPVPLRSMLPLGVGAPEVSAWLLAGAAAIVVLALRQIVHFGEAGKREVTRGRAGARAALIIAFGVAALAAVPLLRAVLAAPRFDAAMGQALGDDFLRDVAPAVQSGMRRNRLVAADLFRGIRTGYAGTTRDVEFAHPEGVRLRMRIYGIAAAAQRRPSLVQIYGGGWQRGEPEDDATFARYFAARGYVVFAIDYRHAPAWRWPAQSDDVRTALLWIRAHAAEYGADGSRVALWGRSAGAHLALLAAYMPGGPPVRAVISFYGPTDLERGYREPPSPDPLGVRTVLETLLGDPPGKRPQAYRDASPITYAHHPRPPTLLVYGARDHIVRHEFAEALDERLRATGTRSVLLEMPWSEHAFDRVPFGPAGQLALYYAERFLAWALSAANSTG